MNCKEGDLAIIIKSDNNNEGKIVRCIKFYPSIDLYCGFTNSSGTVANVWEIDRLIPSRSEGGTCHLEDYKLRPIRDQDGEDEMIKLLGKPINLDVVLS